MSEKKKPADDMQNTLLRADIQRVEDKMSFSLGKLIEYLSEKKICNAQDAANFINSALGTTYELTGNVLFTPYNLGGVK